MPGQIRIANFTCVSGSPFVVPVTVTNGPGQIPRGVVVVVSGSRSPTALDAIHGDAARMSVGAYDFTTYRALGFGHEGGALTAAADAVYCIDTATVVQLPSQPGGLEIEATVSAVGIDTIDLTFSSGSQFYGFVLFVYGPPGTTIDVQSVASSASIGGTVDVSMGFLPDFVLAFGVNQAFVADGVGSGQMLSAGAAARSSATQACGIMCAEDNAITATSVGNLTRSDAFLSTLTSSAGTVTEGTRLEGSFPSSTGYRVTTRNAAVAVEFLSVAISLGGVRAWAGTPAVASNSTGSKSITDPGFKPGFVMMIAQQVASADTVVSTQGQLSLGFATAATEQVCASMRSRDNLGGANTSETGALASTTNIVSVVNGSPGWDWIADLTAMTATGIDINVSDASGAARVPVLLAVEQAVMRPPPPAGQQWRRQRARM